MATFTECYDQAIDQLLIVVEGEVQLGEMTDYAQQRFKPRPDKVLWDLRAANWKIDSVQQLTRVLEKTRETNRVGSRSAIVLGRTVDYGMSRVVEAFSSAHQFSTQYQSFTDIEAALGWLNESREY